MIPLVADLHREPILIGERLTSIAEVARFGIERFSARIALELDFTVDAN